MQDLEGYHNLKAFKSQLANMCLIGSSQNISLFQSFDTFSHHSIIIKRLGIFQHMHWLKTTLK